MSPGRRVDARVAAVFAGEFGNGQDEARPDRRSLHSPQAGAQELGDAGGVAAGSGEGVAGGDADVGIGIVKEAEEQVGVCGDGGAGGLDGPVRRLAAVVVEPARGRDFEECSACAVSPVLPPGRRGGQGKCAGAVMRGGVGGDT